MRTDNAIKWGATLSLMICLIFGLFGCYTIISHPQVANGQKYHGNDSTYVQPQQTSPQSGQSGCTSCHNNEYNHSWGIRPAWGFDYWGSYSPNYTPWGYSGWQHYYYDPWWGGSGNYYNYNPWYNYPSGPGAPSAPPPPERDHTRRGDTLMPQTPPPPTVNQPVYIPPPAPNQGQNQPDQGNKDNDDDRRGKRGGK
jgi:hypothetical protein